MNRHKIYLFYMLCMFVLSASSCRQIKKSITDTFKEEVEEEVGASQNAEPDVKQPKTVSRDEHSTPTFAEPEEEPEAPTNFLSDSVRLASAQKALLELPEFQGKDPKFLSDIHFYDDGRVNIDIQDPQKTENIDTYGYDDGEWKEPVPVRTSGRAGATAELLPLSEIDFRSVAKIYDAIGEKSKEIEGAKDVTHIYFVYSKTWSRKQWYASITGLRQGYGVTANITGDKIKFERN